MNSTFLPRHRRALPAITAAPLWGILLAGLALTGCARRPIIVQAPPPTVVQTPAAATVVQTPAPAAPTPMGRDVIFIKEAPPPPREETPPPPPSASYTWVPGYWSMRDGEKMWVPGRYEMPPRSGATWIAPRWERRGDGYVFIEGYWR